MKIKNFFFDVDCWFLCVDIEVEKILNPAYTDRTKSERYMVANKKHLLIGCTLVKAATACSHIPTAENIPAISCKTDNLP